MSNRTRLTTVAVALVLAVPTLLSGCSSSSHPSRTAHAPASKTLGVPPIVKIAPAANSTRLPVTAEIAADVTGGFVTTVTLTDDSGHAVSGSWRPDRSSWVPATSLKFNATYTAKIVATNITGATRTSTASFTTMPAPKSKPISTSINLTDGSTYGVAMPIVVDFGTAIPANERADVERRLFVQSMPAQVGIWSWASPTQVVYRPENHWRTGTVVSVRTALAGLPVGSRVIGTDRTARFTVGKDLEYVISNKKHNLTVMSGGKAIHTYPVSLGKPGHDSWSGSLVIMERHYYTVFDTLGIPGENYRVGVNFAERLTWSGTFIHSAPWSVYAQGHYNVSHGCVNVGPSNASWIYKNSQIGDPVTITGTGHPVANGNGWTAWNVSWADFVKGSALGHVANPLVNQNTPAV